MVSRAISRVPAPAAAAGSPGRGSIRRGESYGALGAGSWTGLTPPVHRGRGRERKEEERERMTGEREERWGEVG